MLFVGRLCFVGLNIISLLHFTKPMILLTANVDDLRRVAEKFLPEAMVQTLQGVLSKLAQEKKVQISKENEDNENFGRNKGGSEEESKFKRDTKNVDGFGDKHEEKFPKTRFNSAHQHYTINDSYKIDWSSLLDDLMKATTERSIFDETDFPKIEYPRNRDENHQETRFKKEIGYSKHESKPIKDEDDALWNRDDFPWNKNDGTTEDPYSIDELKPKKETPQELLESLKRLSELAKDQRTTTKYRDESPRERNANPQIRKKPLTGVAVPQDRRKEPTKERHAPIKYEFTRNSHKPLFQSLSFRSRDNDEPVNIKKEAKHNWTKDELPWGKAKAESSPEIVDKRSTPSEDVVRPPRHRNTSKKKRSDTGSYETEEAFGSVVTPPKKRSLHRSGDADAETKDAETTTVTTTTVSQVPDPNMLVATSGLVRLTRRPQPEAWWDNKLVTSAGDK